MLRALKTIAELSFIVLLLTAAFVTGQLSCAQELNAKDQTIQTLKLQVEDDQEVINELKEYAFAPVWEHEGHWDAQSGDQLLVEFPTRQAAERYLANERSQEMNHEFVQPDPSDLGFCCYLDKSGRCGAPASAEVHNVLSADEENERLYDVFTKLATERKAAPTEQGEGVVEPLRVALDRGNGDKRTGCHIRTIAVAEGATTGRSLCRITSATAAELELIISAINSYSPAKDAVCKQLADAAEKSIRFIDASRWKDGLQVMRDALDEALAAFNQLKNEEKSNVK